MQKQLDMIEKYADFSDPSAVYILLLLPRKKENKDQVEREKLQKRSRFVVSNMDDVKFALEEFDRYSKMYPEVVFRIYISVNRRSLLKGMLNFQKKLLDFNKSIMDGNTEVWTPIAKLGSEFKSVLAKKESKHDRNWFFDIDISNDDTDVFATEIVQEFRERVAKVTDEVYFGKSKSGYAMVAKPFNPKDIVIPEGIEMKKDSYLYVDILNDKE